jgi:hypothetical protein
VANLATLLSAHYADLVEGFDHVSGLGNDEGSGGDG